MQGQGGAVFKVTADGKESVLYSFTGNADGNGPLGGLVTDSAGNAYGTAFYGGSLGGGVVLKLSPGWRRDRALQLRD